MATIKKNPIFQFSEFNDLILGRFLFVIGLKMLNTLLGWWLFEITNNVLFIGLIGLVEVFPTIGLSLYAGHIIDMSEKRILLLRCVFAMLFCVIILTFLSVLIIEYTSYKSYIIGGIYLIIMSIGCIRAFMSPIFNTIMPNMVTKPFLSKATTLNSASWLFGGILGHAGAGFSIAFLGLTVSFIIIISLLIASFCVLHLLLPKPSIISKSNIPPKKINSIINGIKFVFNDKLIFSAMSLDLFAVFFGGIVAIIPVIAKDILHVGPIGYAWLNMSADLGSGVMLLLLLFVPIKKKQGLKLFITVAIFGCSIIIFSFSKSLLLSCLALFISGLSDTINSIIRGTIVQIKTPDTMRGRVMGINTLFTNSSNELGKLQSGVAAHVLGTMPSVLFGGVMTLLIVGISYIKSPELRKFEY